MAWQAYSTMSIPDNTEAMADNRAAIPDNTAAIADNRVAIPDNMKFPKPHKV